MSALLRELKNAIDSNRHLSSNEQDQIKKLVRLQMPAYSFTLKRSYKNKVLGEKQDSPINPFSLARFDKDLAPEVFEFFNEFDVCGQFATQRQWLQAHRFCKGEPVLKTKVKNKTIKYFAYEQTEPI